MKKYLLTISLLIALTVQAQYAFQDAKVIRDGCVTLTPPSFGFKPDDESVRILTGFLKNYLPEADRNNPALTEDQVLTKFKDNPFFGNEIQTLMNAGASATPTSLISSGINKLGGLNVTSVADGIARFLVERTKAELDVYFFERFKEFLDNNDYGKDLKVLFPNTHSVMSVVGKEIYNYQMYLQSLREAFAHDLSALVSNTNQWINQNHPSALVSVIQNSSLYPYLQLSLQLAVDMQGGKHPGDILNDLTTRDFSNKAVWDDFGSILKTANLISQSLRSGEPGHYWISTRELSTFQDVTFAKIYFGLIYKKAEALNIIVGGTTLTTILADFANHIDKGQRFIYDMTTVLIQADQLITTIKTQSEQGIANNYVQLGNSILDIAKITNASLFAAQEKSLFPSSTKDNAQFIFTHTTNLVADIKAKSYSAAVIELSLILESLSVNTDFVKGITRYGTFMAGVATAKTSEEVKQAIEVVALPPGSYRVKRESYTNISLNAYVGFYGGNEYMPESQQKDSFSAGVFAPVGFAFSWGNLKYKEEKGGKSFSIFASIIDVGTLASFRFNDPNTTVSSEIKLRDIVAPGMFLIHGFGKSPISIGGGVQIGPSLRDVDPSGVANINKDYYVRVAGFIAVDIPVFNLYNRKDKKK